nr:coiled-coil domain-containing protein 17 isoform X2 [Danio rerio]|eukprot:XP_021332860.1 coiled-coil domain-containing protein 17 isoform X2 [Danio rerio]
MSSVDGPLSAQIRALRLAYMQSGGSDPEVLAHMHDLQTEALTLEQTRPRADGRTKARRMKSPQRSLDPDILALEQENQKLEEEIFRIQQARERHKGENGSGVVDIQKDHIYQMESLQAEIAFLSGETEQDRERRQHHLQPPLSVFPESSMALTHPALKIYR